MELQALLMLCGVGVAGFAVLLLILMGLFSTSGTSYEDAIAQQRKATSELLALAENKNKSKKTNKKANKKLAKKEKIKENTAVTGSELESEAPAESGLDDDTVPIKPHVEFCPPVVLDDEPPTLVKIRKRGKDSKVKPILINKEDASCVSDPISASIATANVFNHFEEMQPKDEFELLYSSMGDKVPEKKEEAVEKKDKAPKQGKAKSSPPKQKEIPAESVKEDVPRPVEAPLEQRKARKAEKKQSPAESAPVEEVVPPLNPPQPSELTTEKLLKQAMAPATARDSPVAGKNKKKKQEQNVLSLIAGDGGGVAVGELVRVVREAALSRTEIQILTDALLDKHHDQLPEHSDWTEGPNDPMQKLKKQLAEKEKALADEVEASQALHAKLKELRTNLNAERVRATAVTRAGEQAAAATRAELHTLQTRLQRLLEDNRALAQDKLVLQAKLSEDGDAQTQRVQMEMHIQRLSEAEAALVTQLGVLQAELAARVHEVGQTRCDAAAARDSLLLAQQHAAELAQQLQEANRVSIELEQQRQCAVQAEQVAQQELRAARDHLTELKNEVQRLTSRAQTADSSAEKVQEDLEKLNRELTKECKTLREQVASAEGELAELRALKAAPAQNGLPPPGDDLKAAELSKVESVVEALRAELTSAQRSCGEQQTQLAQLREQVAHHQRKNDELRTKNWKIMEALQSAERALQTSSARAPPARPLDVSVTKAQESQLNDVVALLSSACPCAAPTCPPGNDWLQTFADNLKQELQKMEAEKKQIENELSSKLVDVENQKKKLESDLNIKLQENKKDSALKQKLDESELAKKQLEIVMQKKIQESELEKRQIENEMKKKLEEKELVRKQLETDLKKKLQESEIASRKIVNVETSGEASSRVKDLQMQNENLQALVDKYKRIIDDTEGVLSRLQQNVSREEQRWEQVLADKQRELDQLRQTTVQQLEKKIETLHAELQLALKQNHSNSFADAERSAEERLLSVGLTERNGPLSVSGK